MRLNRIRHAILFLGLWAVCVAPVAFAEELPGPLSDLGQDSFLSASPVPEVAEAGKSLHRTADFVQFESCPECDSPHSLLVGASVFFARPHMKESFQANVVNLATGTSQLIPLDYDHQVSPRLWIGFEGPGELGVRLSYWQFDHQAEDFQAAASFTEFPGASATTVIFPANISTMAPGEILRVNNSLEVHTIDLEGTSRIHLGDFDLLASAGIRYASMEQTFGARASGLFPPRTLRAKRELEGTGLTVGVDAQKPLFAGFSVVGSGQGSLIYGEKTLVRSVVGDITPNMPPPNVALEDATEVSGIFDLALGVQWAAELTTNAEFFVQGKYETSLWTAAGFPTLTFLGFEGFSLTTGLNW